VYPDERVARLINEHFVPARVHVKEQPEDFQRLGDRFNAHWTPTVLFLEPDGTERHRIEGFLPTEDFAAQLLLGLGKAAFARQRWEDAEQRFRQVVEEYPSASAAPEARYWAGVARYKRTNDPEALRETARDFTQRYEDSEWAKRASIWLPQPAATM
jgi:tetratricopeptide (TPR) repeat protein